MQGVRLGAFLPLLSLILTGACGTAVKSPSVFPLPVEEPVVLELSGSLSREEVIHYYFASEKEEVIGSEKPKVKKEDVNFVVQTQTKEVFPRGEVSYDVRVLSRKGEVPLHDLAFPDLGEEFEQILTRNAKVIKAGSNSPDSVFFLPPVPLPDQPVKVGDTWTMKHIWASENSGVPLQLDLVAIFKGLYPCGTDDRCADLEISGQVTLAQPIPSVQLESEITGHMLFAVDQGSVIWSEIRTTERLQADTANVQIKSCMKSLIEAPSHYVWPHDKKLNCDPKSNFANIVPGIASEFSEKR